MSFEAAAYPLANNRLECERLTVQSRAWQPTAERLFDEIGVAEGWRCADLGCGPIGVLEPLSKRVGRTGAVVGIDVSPGFLASGVRDNVSLVRADLFASMPDLGTFDLAHVRFVFAPTGRHRELLARLMAVTRPGGIIAAQEPDARSWRLVPSHAGFDRLVGTIRRASSIAGGDFEAGRRLRDWFTQAGLQQVKTRATSLLLAGNDRYLRMPLEMAESLRPKIAGSGLLKNGELDALIAECSEALSSGRYLGMSFTLVQAWGIRPAVY